jgi:pimeloyl-ACP methyl ester carboxylesterase
MQVRLRTLIVSACVGLVMLVATHAGAQTVVPGPCKDSELPTHARIRICVPSLGWNGFVVLYAHGFVVPALPLGFYQTTLPDNTPIDLVLQSQGFAFATTSYRRNGLNILEGIEDVRDLLAEFTKQYPNVVRTYVVGLSEGGLVATLLAERSPELNLAGALAMCGPIGGFRAQVNYVGDFRVLFDYYFPGLIPGSAVNIPLAVMQNWDAQYVPVIAAALATDADKTAELLRVAKAPYDPATQATAVNTALDLLRYNVFATNDAALRLGGNPYGNRTRWYFGSSNDLRLNLFVKRFTASGAAIRAMRLYETSGQLPIPLVTLHTLTDDIVPVWQELLYLAKVDPFAHGVFLPLPVKRYGHCTFTNNEVLGAFGLMVSQQ